MPQQRKSDPLKRQLLRWYDHHRRPLPWRVPVDADPQQRPDPYHVLVSETMLQQTQVATVIPYFQRFIQTFPTLEALAAAPEQQVLRLWQGLGYYSRARNLQRTARTLVDDHDGKVPQDLQTLLKLPGIGRYTAGAIASIAFDLRAPILDGNVMRVIARLDLIEVDPRTPRIQQQLWKRAEQLLPRRRIGDFNSALMELGSTICTPRSPDCARCPVRRHCMAFAAGRQNQIPAPRVTRPSPLIHRWTFCIRHRGRWLIQQRPHTGRWPGMWQFLTVDPAESNAPADWLRQRLGFTPSGLRPLTRIDHALTHRRYRFDVFCCTASARLPDIAQPYVWTSLKDIDHYPLPRPHARIAQLLAQAQ